MKHNINKVIKPQRTKFDHQLNIITTTISSVNPITLAKHQVGNILDIVLGKYESLFLEDEDGELLGAIRLNNSTILDDIKKGKAYEVEILAINTPACVQVRRKYCDL